MTNKELQQQLTRIGDARLARRTEIDGAAAAPTTAGDRTGAPFAIGDRIFDPATGRSGEVIRVGAFAGLGRTPIDVALDGGGTVSRLARDVVSRPRRPAPRS